MQKIKFDFEATKERIYAPNSNVPIGAPVDRNGNIANDGNAYGIVLCKETENEKYWVRYNLVVMVAGYCDIIDAQEIWGDEYSAEAIAAMSDIIFCDDHKIGGGGGWPADLPKPSVGGYGYTEQGEQTVITWDGDTEGRESVLNAYFKVSDETPSESAISNGEIVFVNGVSGTVGDGAEVSDIAIMFADGNILLASSSGQVVTEDITFDIPSAGIYFMKEPSVDNYITSLTYGTPDTIHKIDEKYLPEAGGGSNDFVIHVGHYGQIGADGIAELNELENFMSNKSDSDNVRVTCVFNPTGAFSITIPCSVNFDAEYQGLNIYGLYGDLIKDNSVGFYGMSIYRAEGTNQWKFTYSDVVYAYND